MKRNKSRGVKIISLRKTVVNQMKNSAFSFPVCTVTETVSPVRSGCNVITYSRLTSVQCTKWELRCECPYFFQIKISGRS
jgi:hypothetical protein